MKKQPKYSYNLKKRWTDYIIFTITVLVMLLALSQESKASQSGTELQHACLNLMVFLESKGEDAKGHAAVAMVIINRVKSNKYPDTVCEVISQRSQFEPYSRYNLKHIVSKIKAGDVMAGVEYLRKEFEYSFNRKYMDIDYINYNLLTGREDIWIDGHFFYSPSSLKKRGLPEPSWIRKKTMITKIGKHIFLK